MCRRSLARTADSNFHVRSVDLAPGRSNSGIPTTLCHEHKDSRTSFCVRNCLNDEGRSLGIGLQEQVPNHLRRLWSKAMVVKRGRKRSGITASGDRQEEDRKETTDEVSKVYRRCPKPRL